MKKTLALVLSLVMLLTAATAMAATEINYWSVFTGGDGAVMQGMVDAFNASQDEVVVNHTPMTADDLFQKVPLAVQTGTDIPDVCVVHIERIPNFVNQEMLYSYDLDLVAEAGIKAEAEAYEQTEKKGKTAPSFQFMRLGYFCMDSKDSSPEHLVFNRSVSLKDSFKM